MFEVFSLKLQRLINADNVTDLSDKFRCPNCDCNALYTLKAVDSAVKRKHFGRKKSTPHTKGCPYDNEARRYIDDGNLIKNSVEEIFYKTTKKSSSQIHLTNTQTTSSERDIKYIRTAKQLFNYCISNSIYTFYQDGITVGNIFLDERNIYFDGNFKGKDGIYFVLGKTYKFYASSNCIEMYLSTTTPNNKTVYLNIRVYLEKQHFTKIVEYILNTFHDFAGHSIAILGNWECYDKYHIQCEASPSNVIYKFKDEV